MATDVEPPNQRVPGADGPTAGTGVSALPPLDDLAVILDGGGARAAYQVGLLKGLAKRYPDLRLPIITGVSAGAINAAFLASHQGSFSDAVNELSHLWANLAVEQVFCVDTKSLLGNLWHWGVRLVSGGGRVAPPLRGLVDTAPLRRTLATALAANPKGEVTGIARNLASKKLVGLAVVTSSYTTGRTVAWVEGHNIQDWERPFRHSKQARVTVDHVVASSALPLLFPAVKLEGAWYGDGGIRLITPFSAAIHMGANRLLAFSTKYPRSVADADRPQVHGYPPPAQIAGQLLNAIFLDDHERDALTLSRINWLLSDRSPERRHGLRVLDLVFVRPSVNLGRLAGDFEPRLPWMLRHLLRSAGARATTNPDLLSLLMFDQSYLKALMEIGEADAEANAQKIDSLLKPPAALPAT